eukprot:scaffold96052_cov19-Tisochrysis_lutea.AAC.2
MACIFAGRRGLCVQSWATGAKTLSGASVFRRLYMQKLHAEARPLALKGKEIKRGKTTAKVEVPRQGS